MLRGPGLLTVSMTGGAPMLRKKYGYSRQLQSWLWTEDSFESFQNKQKPIYARVPGALGPQLSGLDPGSTLSPLESNVRSWTQA